MSKATLAIIHLLLAAFMLPAAIMYLLTGALYTWGIKGEYKSTPHEVALQQPLSADLAQLVTVASDALQDLRVEYPSGGATIRRAGTSFQLEWTGAVRDVVLEPTDNPLLARLIVKDTTWYRHLVQLHKAKGGTLFKVYAVAWSIGLLVILLSGLLLAWQEPPYRRFALQWAAVGLLAFVLAVALS